MSELTVMDLMRCVFWAGFAGVPLIITAKEAEKNVTMLPLIPLGVLLQIAFGVACYIAGVRA